jgi:hypothetical protein
MTHPAVVVDVAEIAKPIEEEADTGSGGADHFRQGLLADLGDDRNGLRSWPKLAISINSRARRFSLELNK